MRGYFEPQPEGMCSTFYATFFLSKVNGLLVYIHAARDCVANLRCHISVARLGSPLYTPGTVFNEREAIFGAVDKVYEAIRQLIERKRPKAVAIIEGCTSLTINEDLMSVAEQLSEETGVPVIVVKAGYNCRAEYMGAGEALKSLIDLMDAQEGAEATRFNILGYATLHGRVHMSEILKPMKLNSAIVSSEGSPIDQIIRAPLAGVNIPLHVFAEEALKEIMRRFGIPYVDVLPYGTAPTRLAVERVSDVTGVKVDTRFDRWEHEVEKLKDKLSGRKVLIASSLGREVNLASIAVSLGMETVVFTSYAPPLARENVSFIEENGGEFHQERSVYETIKRVSGEEFDFVIGNWIMGSLAIDMGAWFFSRISIANMDMPGFLGVIKSGRDFVRKLDGKVRRFRDFMRRFNLVCDPFLEYKFEGDGIGEPELVF